MALLLTIIIICILAVYVWYLREQAHDYTSAQIIEKSEDGDFWFYVKPFGSYVGEEPTLINVNQDTFDRFEIGDWLTI